MTFRDDFRELALGFEGAWLDHAWDMEGDVYKTAAGKIFLICAGDGAAVSLTLKLSADESAAALSLPFVREAAWPRRWLTASVTNEPERDIAIDWVARSYDLAAARKR